MKTPTMQFFPSPLQFPLQRIHMKSVCTCFYKIHVFQILEPYVKCRFTLRSSHWHYVGVICVVICFIMP